MKNMNWTKQIAGNFLLAEFSKVLNFFCVHFLEREAAKGGGRSLTLPFGWRVVNLSLLRFFSYVYHLVPELGRRAGGTVPAWEVL